MGDLRSEGRFGCVASVVEAWNSCQLDIARELLILNRRDVRYEL